MARAGETIHNRTTGETITWVETASDSSGARLRFRFSVAPRGRLPVRHLHPAQTERFAVTAGQFVVDVGGSHHLLGPGDTLTIAAGKPHAWHNPSADSAAVMQVTFEPALNTEVFLEQFFGLGNAGRTAQDGTPRFLQIMAMVNEYQLYVAGPPVPVQKLMGWTIGTLARLAGYRRFYPEFSR